MRLWCVLRLKQKILREYTEEFGENATLADALELFCALADMPRPLVLNKHLNEFEQFGRAVFKRDDFVETVPCDRFEIEHLRPGRASNDIRNAQGSFSDW